MSKQEKTRSQPNLYYSEAYSCEIPPIFACFSKGNNFSRNSVILCLNLSNITHLFCSNKDKKQRQRQNVVVLASSSFATLVLWEIVKWSSSLLLSYGWFSLKKYPLLHVTHTSRGTWQLVLSGLLVQKALCNLPNSWLFSFPLQTWVLEHNHHQSLCNRPTPVKRIEIRRLCVFHHPWHELEFGPASGWLFLAGR